jgi:hypothetical protein
VSNEHIGSLPLCMNIITSYFVVRQLPGTVSLGGDVQRHQHARQAEYLDCLRYNRQHPGVAAVHLLVEGKDAYQHLLQQVLHVDERHHHTSTALGRPAATGNEHRRRSLAPIVPVVRLGGGLPTYADFFTYANQLTSQRLTMVCNADVYLSPDHFSVKDIHGLFAQAAAATPSPSDKKTKLALALTRHESDHPLDAPLLYDYRGSHDAFIFLPPAPPSLVVNVRHAQNSYKAENVVLHEFQQCGYVTLNPAFDLRLVHHHAADVRQWFPPVDEARYGRAPPCTLEEASAHLRELACRPPARQCEP